MISRRYGTRLVRHSPPSALPSLVNSRCLSAHSLTVSGDFGRVAFSAAARTVRRASSRSRFTGHASVMLSGLLPSALKPAASSPGIKHLLFQRGADAVQILPDQFRRQPIRQVFKPLPLLNGMTSSTTACTRLPRECRPACRWLFRIPAWPSWRRSVLFGAGILIAGRAGFVVAGIRPRRRRGLGFSTGPIHPACRVGCCSNAGFAGLDIDQLAVGAHHQPPVLPSAWLRSFCHAEQAGEFGLGAVLVHVANTLANSVAKWVSLPDRGSDPDEPRAIHGLANEQTRVAVAGPASRSRRAVSIPRCERFAATTWLWPGRMTIVHSRACCGCLSPAWRAFRRWSLRARPVRQTPAGN